MCDNDNDTADAANHQTTLATNLVESLKPEKKAWDMPTESPFALCPPPPPPPPTTKLRRTSEVATQCPICHAVAAKTTPQREYGKPLIPSRR